MAEERTWNTGSFEYEGFPLYLRYPNGLQYEELKTIYPKFISITHILTEVKVNGLPETDYNQSLINFDEQLVNVLESAGAGITVLVETFGGKRTYYMYAKEDFSPSLLEEKLIASFPEYNLEFYSKNDEDWSFIKTYAKDWKFGTKPEKVHEN